MRARRGEGVHTLRRMVDLEGGPCEACGATTTKAVAWSGQAGGPRYCHRRPCQRAGEAAGHIVRRAQAALARAREEDDGRRFEDGMLLIDLKEIVSTRIYDHGALRGVVASRSKVPSTARVLQFLVYGEYKLTEEDEGGRAYYWMDIQQLKASENVTDEALEEARRAYRAAEDALLSD